MSPREEGNRDVCPRCGMTFAEFSRTGLLGCAECYNAFRARILPTVQRLQGSLLHKGEGPAEGAGKDYDFILEQEHLKEELERALREGRFVDAEGMRRRLEEFNRTKKEEERG